MKDKIPKILEACVGYGISSFSSLKSKKKRIFIVWFRRASLSRR
jgi:hypothetical protein